MKTAEEWAQEIANQAEEMDRLEAVEFYRELDRRLLEDVTALEVQIYEEAC